jgi:hypothetical protein
VTRKEGPAEGLLLSGTMGESIAGEGGMLAGELPGGVICCCIPPRWTRNMALAVGGTRSGVVDALVDALPCMAVSASADDDDWSLR